MKIRTKLFVVILGLLIVVFGGVIAFISQEVSRTAINDARHLAETTAMVHANEVKAFLEVGMDAARTLAHGIEGLRRSGYTDRDGINSVLYSVLERNPDFIGVWTCWEPNAFDGLDEEFASTTHHDSSGRFVPYWSRDAHGRISVVPLEGYESAGEGDYYQLALTTRREVLLEPYDYQVGDQIVTITTMSVPVFDGSRVVGVVGVDVSLDRLAEIANAVTLYETGFARIISHEGLLVTHPTPGRAGRVAGELVTDDSEAREAWRAIRDGQVLSQVSYSAALDSYQFKSLVPIHVGYTEMPWSFGTVIPESEIVAGTRQLIVKIILLGTIGVVVLGLALWFITKPIVRNVKDSTAFVTSFLAKGDFSEDVPAYALELKDEFGDLARGFDTTVRSLRTMIGKVIEGAEQVSVSSNEVAAAVQETASAVEEVASTANQFSSTVELASSNSQKMADLAQQTMQRTNQGAEQIQKTIVTMQTINAAVEELSQEISGLESQSERIRSIVDVITSIADQTNLLALNAAIEAARAGEHGRGFSVVADEVRKLAEQSGKAAGEITNVIGDIRTVVQDTVRKSQESSNKVTEGVALVRDSGDVFTKIQEIVQQLSEGIQSIASASQELAAGSEEIAASSEEQSATVEQIAASIGNVSTITEQLKELVSAFKV